MKHNYEIEIKCLLQTKENADLLYEKLLKKRPETKLVSEEKQINNYFNNPKDFDLFLRNIKDKVKDFKKFEILNETIKKSKKVSVRTRDTNGKIILVLKLSVSDDSSENGVKRIEWEEIMEGMMLDDLDKILIDSGFTYQAKWSRDRKTYVSGNMNISIDKNAGYGYLAEFEMTTDDEGSLDDLRTQIVSFMNELDVNELPQDRLERMFEYYNKNWRDYFGTEKVFNIE